MAASDFIISSKTKVREGEVAFNSPNSEAINSKLSGSINGLIDSDFFDLDVSHPGYIGDSRLFRSAPLRIKNDSTILEYHISLVDSGGSNFTTFNVAIFDDTGASVGDLFGSGANRLYISGDGGTNVVVGRDVSGGTTFNINTGGHTIQYGTLSQSTIDAGSILVPYIEDFANSARSLRFNMKLREF